MIYFGAAGNSDSFYKVGYKNTFEAPDYLREIGINAYEYQCGRGVRVNPEHCEKLRVNAIEKGIKLSLHAPYFISLSGIEEEKRLKSVDYIMQSAQAARLIGADRIIVHSGSCSKISREEALALAKDTLKIARQALVSAGYEDIHICPETMGKINQLGTLEEVAQLCTVDESFVPCIDFGHLNARTLGGIKGYEDYKAILDHLENTIGVERARSFHAHFSKIEYSAGGEKRHLTFDDEIYGPDFEPLAELLVERNCSPTIICESDGTQAEDAKKMFDIYNIKRGK